MGEQESHQLFNYVLALFKKFGLSIEISNGLIYSFCKTVTIWETKSSD